MKPGLFTLFLFITLSTTAQDLTVKWYGETPVNELRAYNRKIVFNTNKHLFIADKTFIAMINIATGIKDKEAKEESFIIINKSKYLPLETNYIKLNDRIILLSRSHLKDQFKIMAKSFDSTLKVKKNYVQLYEYTDSNSKLFYHKYSTTADWFQKISNDKIACISYQDRQVTVTVIDGELNILSSHTFPTSMLQTRGMKIEAPSFGEAIWVNERYVLLPVNAIKSALAFKETVTFAGVVKIDVDANSSSFLQITPQRGKLLDKPSFIPAYENTVLFAGLIFDKPDAQLVTGKINLESNLITISDKKQPLKLKYPDGEFKFNFTRSGGSFCLAMQNTGYDLNVMLGSLEGDKKMYDFYFTDFMLASIDSSGGINNFYSAGISSKLMRDAGPTMLYSTEDINIKCFERNGGLTYLVMDPFNTFEDFKSKNKDYFNSGIDVISYTIDSGLVVKKVRAGYSGFPLRSSMCVMSGNKVIAHSFEDDVSFRYMHGEISLD